jgi:cytochrome c553
MRSHVATPDFHHGLLCGALVYMMCSIPIAAAQTPADAGRQVFVARCASCHGSDGNGGELGPGIASRVPSRTDQELSTLVGQGLPAAGMPAFSTLTETDTADLVRYLRTLKPSNGPAPVRRSVILAGGGALAGLVLNQSRDDLHCWVTIEGSTCSERAAGSIASSPRRPTGPATTARRMAAGTARSARSTRATSPGWLPGGSSACPTPRDCKSRRSWWTA